MCVRMVVGMAVGLCTVVCVRVVVCVRLAVGVGMVMGVRVSVGMRVVVGLRVSVVVGAMRMPMIVAMRDRGRVQASLHGADVVHDDLAIRRLRHAHEQDHRRQEKHRPGEERQEAHGRAGHRQSHGVKI